MAGLGDEGMDGALGLEDKVIDGAAGFGTAVVVVVTEDILGVGVTGVFDETVKGFDSGVEDKETAFLAFVKTG